MEEVIFKNKQFEEYIRKENKRFKGPLSHDGPITKAWMESITFLRLNNINFEDPSDLNHFISLTNLIFMNCKIKEICFVKNMTNLKVLYFNGSQIRDFSPIKALKSLYNFSLIDNPKPDLTIFSSLENLKELLLQGCGLTNLEGLSPLPYLRGLYLDRNEINNLGFIRHFPNLIKLSINQNKISDIKELESLTKLQTLSIDNNQIKDISPLKNLKTLKSLDMKNNLITDISHIKTMNNVNRFYFNGNPIKQIPFLIRDDSFYIVVDMPELAIEEPNATFSKCGLVIKDHPLAKEHYVLQILPKIQINRELIKDLFEHTGKTPEERKAYFFALIELYNHCVKEHKRCAGCAGLNQLENLLVRKLVLRKEEVLSVLENFILIKSNYALYFKQIILLNGLTEKIIENGLLDEQVKTILKEVAESLYELIQNQDRTVYFSGNKSISGKELIYKIKKLCTDFDPLLELKKRIDDASWVGQGELFYTTKSGYPVYSEDPYKSHYKTLEDPGLNFLSLDEKENAGLFLAQMMLDLWEDVHGRLKPRHPWRRRFRNFNEKMFFNAKEQMQVFNYFTQKQAGHLSLIIDNLEYSVSRTGLSPELLSKIKNLLPQLQENLQFESDRDLKFRLEELIKLDDPGYKQAIETGDALGSIVWNQLVKAKPAAKIFIKCLHRFLMTAYGSEPSEDFKIKSKVFLKDKYKKITQQLLLTWLKQITTVRQYTRRIDGKVRSTFTAFLFYSNIILAKGILWLSSCYNHPQITDLIKKIYLKVSAPGENERMLSFRLSLACLYALSRQKEGASLLAELRDNTDDKRLLDYINKLT